MNIFRIVTVVFWVVVVFVVAAAVVVAIIFRKGDFKERGKKMRLNGLMGFVLAGFVCMGLSQSDSGAGVIVTGANQPKATLAPTDAVVPFTNFEIRPGRNKSGLELKKIVVKTTGFGDIDSVADVLVIAKESPGVSEANTGRVVLSSPINSSTVADNTVELINLPEDGGLPVFTKPVKLTISATMKSNLDQYAGQVIYCQVDSIILVRKKNGREVKIKGKFPIVGAGNTINSTLKIGSLSVEAKEDGSYDLMAGSEEPVRISKMALRTISSQEVGEPNSYSLYIEKTGEVLSFKREGNVLYIVFKEEMVIEKGENLKVELRADEGNSLWEIISLYPEDVEAYGNYYNYRIMPRWVEEG